MINGRECIARKLKTRNKLRENSPTQKQPQEAAAAAASPRLDDIVLAGFGPLVVVRGSRQTSRVNSYTRTHADDHSNRQTHHSHHRHGGAA